MAYRIEEACTGCGLCAELCPVKCIAEERKPFVIDPGTCIDCGVCAEHCPTKVIVLSAESSPSP